MKIQNSKFKTQNSKMKNLHLKLLSFFIFYFLLFTSSAQPNTDNQYAKPLKEVLTDIQKKYGIIIKYADSMIANKKVTYAEWKYRPDVEVTLDNILKPLELKVKKEK